MLRSDNFMAPLLCESTVVCGFIADSPVNSPICLGDHHLSVVAAESNLNVCLTAPHTEIDAYGALYLLKLFGQMPKAAISSGSVSGSFQNSTIVHFWSIAPPRSHTKSFMRQFLDNCLMEISWFRNHAFGIAVSLEDRTQLNIENCRGNGFVVPSLSVATIEKLSLLPKQKWRDELVNRARRTKAITAVKKLKIPEEQIIISSLGKTEKLPWAPAMGPDSVFVTATPAIAGNGHVSVWSRGEAQGLTLCAAHEHPIVQESEAIARVWRSQFNT